MTAKGLLLQVTAFLTALAGFNALFGRYAPRHFVPTMKLAAAESQPAPSLVFLGDSRADAAMDYRVLRDRLGERGVTLPLDDLGMDAGEVPGQAVLFRALREKKPRIAGLVVCAVGESLIDPPEVIDPDTQVGNSAIVFVLSRPSDVFTHFPGFPFRHLDPGLRFLFGRSCALEAYKSLIWMKLRVAMDRAVKGPNAGKVNQFGMVRDMVQLAEDLRGRVPTRFRDARTGNGWRLNPWFVRIRDDLRRTGTPMILVELPMPSEYEQAVQRSPEAREFRAWLARQVRADGGLDIDLSDHSLLGISDADFPDRLHIGPEGSARLSTVLGDRLAGFLADRPAE
jgi:hypothetical protein